MTQETARTPDPFGRRLRIGDRGQVKAMAALNCDGLYCPACWHVERAGWTDLTKGQCCPKCRRMHLVYGAAHPKSRESKARRAAVGA